MAAGKFSTAAYSGHRVNHLSSDFFNSRYFHSIRENQLWILAPFASSLSLVPAHFTISDGEKRGGEPQRVYIHKQTLPSPQYM